jgi:predicted DNA-binding transcriptional regulator YafY
MSSTTNKKSRMLEIFFRAMKGERISVKQLALEYEVSAKSISRDIGEIKTFLCENRELVGNIELKFSSNSKSYYLEFDNFLLNKELIAIIEMMIGCRAFSKMETLELISKLKNFTSFHDRAMLEKMIQKEMYHYKEVNHDCKSVIDNLWQLTRCIHKKIEISITYYKMSRDLVKRRLKPIATMFSENYFYLIAYRCDKEDWKPLYYRIDRIIAIVEHRTQFTLEKEHDFDEGELRNKIQFMFPGEYRKIKFEYTGPSVQAILDRIPTAKIIDKNGEKSLIEAETFGTGINMFLLSQGSKVKAISPLKFVQEMKAEIQKLYDLYDEKEA